MRLDPAWLTDPLEIVPFTEAIDATATPPGSKSITNRALLCAALSPGESAIERPLWSDDTQAMLQGLRALGVDIDGEGGSETVTVRGCAGRLRAGPVALDARLSGTTSRFLAAAVALGNGEYRIDAEPSMRARPMGASIELLRQLDAQVVEEGEPGHLPLTVTALRHESSGRGAHVEVRGDVTSQALSGLLMIGPCLPGGLEVQLATELVSRPYVELTVAVMRAFGAEVHSPSARSFVVAGGGYRGPADGRYRVEPDATAATYLLGAVAVRGGRMVVAGLGSASLQGDVHFADVLEQMGARVTRRPHSIEMTVNAPLRGVDVDLSTMSDTAQTLAAVAVFASGPTRVRGIGFVRGKETDRIAAVVAELKRLGIDAAEEADGFLVHPGTPHPGVVRTYDDHRMAMSFALIGLRAPGIRIADPGCVAKTFPGYFAMLESLRPAGELDGDN